MTTWSDQIYRLMPVVHQIRDAENQDALRALLALIGEQVQQIQDDIDQLYDNWFIETSDDWVVPYIGDLVGFRRAGLAGEPADAISPRGQLLNRFLYPRREIANLVRRRRRKGTLSVLEDMARDVSGWSSRAVEFSRLVTFFQNVKHPQPKMGRTFSIRPDATHPRVNTPFDRVAHTVDVKAIEPAPGVGWYHPKKVGLFVWRRKVLPATLVCPYRTCRKICCRATCQTSEVTYFTFNRVGVEAPIYVRPIDETDELHIANESNLPVPLYRHLLANKTGRADDVYYGINASVPKSLAIYTRNSSNEDWSLIPGDRVIVVQLCDQTLVNVFQTLGGDCVAVDPERGILAFGCRQMPHEVAVSFHYATTMEMGGGEYDRTVIDKPDAEVVRLRNDACCNLPNLFQASLDQLSKPDKFNSRCRTAASAPALRQSIADATQPENMPRSSPVWTVENNLCIEITDSDSFEIPACDTVRVLPGKSLIIRAAGNAWPMLHLRATDSNEHPAPWRVQLGARSEFVMDGLLVCGVTTQFEEIPPSEQASMTPDARIPVAQHSTCRPCNGASDSTPHSLEGAVIHLSHSTFIPGGKVDLCHERQHASFRLTLPQASVAIRHSIVGTLNVEHSSCANCGCCGHGARQSSARTCPIDPIAIELRDSIVDAACGLPAIYSNCCSPAHADLIVERSTILGDICTQQMTRAEDSLFAGIVHVQRRGIGYMRFCYVPTSRQDIIRLRGSCLTALHRATIDPVGHHFPGTPYDGLWADWCHVVRTPRRFKCIPGGPVAVAVSDCVTGYGGSSASAAAHVAGGQNPSFVNTEYGQPGYCELDLACPGSILNGAEDQSEVGVFHDLYRPQRDSALRSRLQEYTPADMQSAVIYADDLHPATFRNHRPFTP